MSLDERDIQIEKLKADIQKARINGRYGLLATFFGTFLVAVIGSYLTFVTDTTKNEQSFDSDHREFVSKFVEIAIDDDIERRQRLAKYFATVTIDPAQKQRWEEYSSYVDSLIENNPEKISELETRIQSLSEEQVSERRSLESQISLLEKQLSPTRTAPEKRYTFDPACFQIQRTVARFACIAEHERAQGVREIVGAESNPRILQYASEVGIDYTDDDIPWAGLFVAWVVKIGDPGADMPTNVLGNRNWLDYGVPTEAPEKGTIAVFWRQSPSSFAGHVGFYMGEDDQSYHVLGGNQANQVSIARLKKERLLGFRNPE